MPPKKPSRVNLVHVVYSLYPYAGMERKVIELVNRLDPETYRCSIIALHTVVGEPERFLDDRVRTFALNKQEGRQLGLIRPLANLLRELDADIVHSHNWATLLHSAAAVKLAGVPVFIHGEHGRDSSDLNTSLKHRLLRYFLFSRTDALISVSASIQKAIVEHYYDRPAKMHLIPNGVDTSATRASFDPAAVKRRYGIPEDHLVVGTLSWLRPVKDLPTLVRAFAQVRSRIPDISLLLAGGYSRAEQEGYMDSLRRDIAEAGVEDHVYFTDEVQNVPELFSAMDVYVNSSLTEGMSNTILEAMAMELPIVASAVGGNVELVSDGTSGYLFPAGDVPALVDHLYALLSDRTLRERLGKGARASVVGSQSLDSMVARNHAIYRDLLYRKARVRVSGKGRVKRALDRVVRASGLSRLARSAREPRLTILALHRVIPQCDIDASANAPMMIAPENFERLLDTVRRDMVPLSLDEVVRMRRAGEPLPPRSVVLTFDDGYVDNYACAFPLLAKYGVPATIFLTTDLIGQIGKAMWWDVVERRLLETEPDAGRVFEHSTDGIRKQVEEILRHPREKRVTPVRDLIRATLKDVSREDRNRFVSSLGPLGSDESARLMMDWEQVREMARGKLIAFGSHTTTHPYLPEVENGAARLEVEQSKQRIENEIQQSCTLLAYPGGQHSDGVVEIVEQAGFDAAVTTRFGGCNHETPRFRLPRIDVGYALVDDTFSRTRFLNLVDGVYDYVYRDV